MIIELRAKNCFSFYEQINFSMKADMRSSKFKSNVHTENYFNILKTAGIYGPNNVGKTCLVKCIKAVKAILSNGKNEIMPNLFHQNPICELGITFLWRGREFSYDFHYDVKKEEYPYEKFSEIIKDQYGNTREEIWVLKDSQKEIYDFKDKKLCNIIQVVAKTNLLIYTIDSKKFKYLAMMKDIVRDFANTIDIVYMNDIPMERTINLLKNKNNLQKKVVEFIKNADLYMDDYEYMEINKLPLKDSEDYRHIYHVFVIRCAKRDELEKYLNENGIGTVKHYPIPMHLQEAYKDLNIKEGSLPIAEEISKTVLSIPMYYGMTDEEVNYVIDKINQFK